MDKNSITNQIIKLHHDGGQVLRYEYDGTSIENEKDLLKFVISSLFSLEIYGVKLHSMDFHMSMADMYSFVGLDINGINNPFHLFLDTSFDNKEFVETEMVNQIIDSSPPFTPDKLANASWELLEFERSHNTDNESIPVWDQLSFRSLSFPISKNYLEDGAIPLEYGSIVHKFKVSSENQLFVKYPMDNGKMLFPLRFDVHNTAQLIHLDITLNWSYFYTDTHEGFYLVTQYFDYLTKSGWKKV